MARHRPRPGEREQAMAPCGECEAALPRAARFCPSCGAAGVPGPRHRDARRSEGSRRRTLLGGLALVGIVIGLATLGSDGSAPDVVGAMRSDDGPSAGEGTTSAPATETPGLGAGALGDSPDEVGRDTVDPVPAVPPTPATRPACLRPDGASCGVPLPDLDDVVLATPVGHGRWLMVDRHAQAVGVELHPDGRSLVHWRTPLPAELATAVALRETTPVGGARMSARSEGNTVYLGDGAGITAIDALDGVVAWRTTLGGSAAPPSFRVWPVDDALIAVGAAEVAALELDGRVRWRAPRPPGDVQPIDGGIAVVGRERIDAFGVDAPDPRWSRSHPAPGSRPALGVVGAAVGPLLLDGPRTVVLGADDGEVVVDHGRDVVATRLTDGTVVVARWEDGGRRVVFAATSADGGERWRQPGPALRCCELLLRPTQQGTVLAATIGRGRSEVGWSLDAATGEIRTRVHRPQGAAPLPVALDGEVAVWRAGDALIGARASDGTVTWRSHRSVMVLNETPLLLATSDGPVTP